MKSAPYSWPSSKGQFAPRCAELYFRHEGPCSLKAPPQRPPPAFASEMTNPRTMGCWGWVSSMRLNMWVPFQLSSGLQVARTARGPKQNSIICWEDTWEVGNPCQSCILPLPLKIKVWGEKTHQLTSYQSSPVVVPYMLGMWGWGEESLEKPANIPPSCQYSL
jgi:hypothetical protein